MYFYNPRSIIVYQSGGSTQQEIQNYIQDLQQKIDTLNEAIARADPGEVVVYNNGFPTGELEDDLYPIVNVGQDELFDGIQQEKINARDYFQNKLDNLKVKKIQSLYRGNKSRLLSKAEGRITDKQKRKDWTELRQSLLNEGFTDEEIQSFYDNHYMVSQQMGGAVAGAAVPVALVTGQEMTIEQIRAATLDRDVEICGEIRNGKFIYHNTGVNDGSRGLCQLPRHYEEGEWHTHAHTHRFYPSNEDFHKIMYNINKKSLIFTPHGYWTLECLNKISEEIAKSASRNQHIEHVNNWFATQETDNRGISPRANTDFNRYLNEFNTKVFPNTYGVNCNISWTPY